MDSCGGLAFHLRKFKAHVVIHVPPAVLCCMDETNRQAVVSIGLFTITAEIHVRSLANFYCQYADRHMNLKFMRRVSEREPAIQQFVIVKNKLTSELF